MQKSIHFPSPPFLHPQNHKSPPNHFNKNPTPSSPKPPILTKNVLISPKTPTSSPKSPPKPPLFLEKMLFLDSVGIDFFPIISSHPKITSFSLLELQSTVKFLLSLGFSSTDLRRMCGMCPELLTCGGSKTFKSIISFLLEEVGVQSCDLCYIISRRPRLLVSNLNGRLRPTLHFLQKLGVSNINGRHTHLLSCSVEKKFLPRIEFLQQVGFSLRDSNEMVRRFPQIFCYSVKGNLEPKLEFFKGIMGRELREIRMFPQYFSFSLERRIEKRYWLCERNAVFFELPALLRPSDEEFLRRLEVCVGSSGPLRKSPLWKEGFVEE